MPTVEHHCPYGCCPSAESTLKGIAIFVAWALVPHRCPVFPRSRWTHSDEAFDYLGLLACCHGLLESLVVEMTGGPDKESESTSHEQQQQGELWQVLDNQHVDVDNMDEWASMMQEEISSQSGLGLGFGRRQQQKQFRENLDEKEKDMYFMEPETVDQPDADDSKNADAAANANTSPELPPVMSGSTEIDWAAEKRRNKKKARLWSKTDPGPRLIVVKQTLGLLLKLMYRFLFYSGKEWDRQQKFMSSQGKFRSYRVLLAHLGVDVQQCIDELGNLLVSPPKALMIHHLTDRIQALRFKLNARALCNVHFLLKMPRDLHCSAVRLFHCSS